MNFADFPSIEAFDAAVTLEDQQPGEVMFRFNLRWQAWHNARCAVLEAQRGDMGRAKMLQEHADLASFKLLDFDNGEPLAVGIPRIIHIKDDEIEHESIRLTTPSRRHHHPLYEKDISYF